MDTVQPAALGVARLSLSMDVTLVRCERVLRISNRLGRSVHAFLMNESGEGADEMSRVRQYLNTHRINVNVRKVEDEHSTFASVQQQQQNSDTMHGSGCSMPGAFESSG